MMSDINIEKLAENIVTRVNETDTTLEAIEVVKKMLNNFVINWKPSPKHELAIENCAWKETWDYDGWKEHYKGIEVVQEDWNNTLLTKINYISALIHKASFRYGGSELRMNPSLEPLLETIPYYENGTLSSRYNVIFDDNIKIDDIFVIHKEWNDIKLIPKVKETTESMSEVSFISLTNCTDDEANEHNKNLIGYIKIDNLPKNN